MLINQDKTSETNNELASQFIKAQQKGLATQSDGYSVYSDGKVVRSMDYSEFNETTSYEPSELFVVHSRIATAGATGLDGTHLQQLASGYYFAHNGTVAKLQLAKIKTDSQLFIEEVLEDKKFNLDRLDEAMEIIQQKTNENMFSGKGVLIKDNKVLLFINSPSYFVRLSDTLLAFTSYLPSDEIDNTEYVYSCGVPFVVSSGRTKLEPFVSAKIDDEYYLFVDGKLDGYGQYNVARTQQQPTTYFNHRQTKPSKKKKVRSAYEEYFDKPIHSQTNYDLYQIDKDLDELDDLYGLTKTK